MFLCGWGKRKKKRSKSTNQSERNQLNEETERTDEYGSAMVTVESNHDITESFNKSMFFFSFNSFVNYFGILFFHSNSSEKNILSIYSN